MEARSINMWGVFKVPNGLKFGIIFIPWISLKINDAFGHDWRDNVKG